MGLVRVIEKVVGGVIVMCLHDVIRDAHDVEGPQGGVQRGPGRPSVGRLHEGGLLAPGVGHEGRAEGHAVEGVLAGIDSDGLRDG